MTPLIVLEVLRRQVKAADDRLRDEARAEMSPGETRVAMLAGVEVGTVQFARAPKGKPTATVTDDRALLRWAQEHAPHLVSQHVNSAGQKVLVDLAKAGGWPDPATGELIPVEGITVHPPVPGSPVLRVLPNEHAEPTIRAEVAAGRLAMDDVVRELPA